MDYSNKNILISIPCRDTIPVRFIESVMQMYKPCLCNYRFGVSGLVYDARDEATQIAVNGGYDYILFVDSDMVMEPEALIKALDRDTDIVTGLYFKRKLPIQPVLFKTIEGRKLDNNGEIVEHAYVEAETDLDREYFQTEGCGFGFCLIKTDLLREMFKKYCSLFEPLPGLGEDLSFCYRLKEFPQYKLMCDATIGLGHMGEYVYTKADWTGPLSND